MDYCWCDFSYDVLHLGRHQLRRRVLSASPQDLRLDAGKILAGRRGLVEIGAGVEYWRNEFGKPDAITPGARQITPFLQITCHLTRAE